MNLKKFFEKIKLLVISFFDSDFQNIWLENKDLKMLNKRLTSKLNSCDYQLDACFDSLEKLKKTDEVFPEVSGEISYNPLRSLLLKKTKKLFLSDLKYKLVTVQGMKNFLARDDTDKEKWTAEYFDCDDFSYRLLGQANTRAWAEIAFGIAWSKSHAFNIFVSASRQVYLIEPQSDKIIKFEDAQGAYKDIQLVVM